MSLTTENSRLTRLLLKRQNYGLLSTHSSEISGFPFGSIVPYTFDEEGHLFILVSTIAEHTKNIMLNPKVSITVMEGFGGNLLNYSRVCYLGTSKQLLSLDTPIKKRFQRYYPHLEGFHQEGPFSFYRIELTIIRLVGGFGKVSWIEPDDFLLDNPFIQDEGTLIDTFNKENKDILVTLCRHHKNLDITDPSILHLAGFDKEGFDMIAGETKLRFQFQNQVASLEDAKTSLIAMSKQASISNPC